MEMQWKKRGVNNGPIKTRLVPHSDYCEADMVTVRIRGRKSPLGISEFSPTPPHSDSVTSGRSLEESDKHSVPLSAAPLPTDWGDWDPDRCPVSNQFFGTGSVSLEYRQSK